MVCAGGSLADRGVPDKATALLRWYVTDEPFRRVSWDEVLRSESSIALLTFADLGGL